VPVRSHTNIVVGAVFAARLGGANIVAVNARKSLWAVKEVDYLGFRLMPKGIKPQARKIAALMNMKAPKTKRQLRRFIGLVNYYRYMWKVEVI